MERGGCVYILTSKTHSTLYIGVTSDLHARINEHRQKKYPGSFTARYNVNKLVYYEVFPSIVEAIAREDQVKAGSRQKKIDLINGLNPDWNDLYEDVQGW